MFEATTMEMRFGRKQGKGVVQSSLASDGSFSFLSRSLRTSIFVLSTYEPDKVMLTKVEKKRKSSRRRAAPKTQTKRAGSARALFPLRPLPPRFSPPLPPLAMKYDEETSSHPLLPTGSSSSPDSPADFDTYPSNPPSKRSSSSRYLSQLKRPRLKGWLALLAVSLAGFALSLVFRGGSSTGTSQVEGWSWKTRPKASEGLVKAGGRRGRNDSYLGESILPLFSSV